MTLTASRNRYTLHLFLAYDILALAKVWFTEVMEMHMRDGRGMC